MSKKILTIDRATFYNYYDYAYVLSLLCSKDVLLKLETDYSACLVEEKNLLHYIYKILTDEPFAFINSDSRLEENLDKIIQNSSNTNRGIINKIKIYLNSYEHPQYVNEPFLRMNYLWRKYGFDEIKQIKRKHNNVSN